MNDVRIFDTTLRDGEQSPGCSMNLAEKLEVARQLDKLGVDVIEAGFAISSPDDAAAVAAVASVVNCTVASLARCTKGDIDAAFEAVKDAKKPRIHVFIATSDIHLEYKLRMTREQVIERTRECVSYARSLCPDIEFSAEDASRSDKEFLARVCEVAIESGATTLNIPDTVGYATPQEIYDLFDYLVKHVKGAEDVIFSAHCHDDLGMGVANTLAAISAGARQAECTINGIGERAGNAALEEIVMALHTRSNFYGVTCGINTKELYRSSKLIASITGVPVAPTKSIVGKNAFAHEAGIHQHGVLSNPLTYEIMSSEMVGIPKTKMVLGKHSGKHALRDRLDELGYSLSPDELEKTFVQFKKLADKKKNVTDKDIEALAQSRRRSSYDAVYEFVAHVVTTGKELPNIACIKLKKGDEELMEVANGDGPINASYKAINMITGMDISLDSYNISAVSEGEDAMGEAVVGLGWDGKTAKGIGVSTDIIEASIKAYVNGINRLLSV